MPLTQVRISIVRVSEYFATFAWETVGGFRIIYSALIHNLYSLPSIFSCGATVQLIIVEDSRLHTNYTNTHTHGMALLNGDHPVAEAATSTTHKKHKRRTSTPSVGFETSIPSRKQVSSCRPTS